LIAKQAQTAQSTATALEQLETITQLVQSNPYVRSCIMSLQARCVQGPIQIKERQQSLATDLKRKIIPHFTTFLRDAIIHGISTGVVPFYLKKIDGINLPFCMELGSYIWTVESHSVEPSNKRLPSETGLLRYCVRPRDGLLPASRIYAFPYETPVFGTQACGGPFDHIIAEYRHFLLSRRKIDESNEWNSSKHVVVTEQVDLKDQTTSGLQLLDEQRRYHLTGKHNNLMHNNLLRLQNRDGFYMDNVRDGIFAHIRSEFSDSADITAPSSKRACCHIMPPNVQVIELQELSIPDLALSEQRFVNTVHAHFNSKAAFSFSDKSTSSAAESELLNSEEQAMVSSSILRLQKLAAVAYAACFDIEVHNVEVSLKQGSKLEQSSASDVKAYADAEVLGGLDKLNLKRKLTEARTTV